MSIIQVCGNHFLQIAAIDRGTPQHMTGIAMVSWAWLVYSLKN